MLVLQLFSKDSVQTHRHFNRLPTPSHKDVFANTCKRASSVNVEKQRRSRVSTGHDDNGAFLKNGIVEYGRHHVKDCMKTLRQDSRGRRKKTSRRKLPTMVLFECQGFKEEEESHLKRSETRVGECENTFGVLGEIDEKISKEDVMNEKFLSLKSRKRFLALLLQRRRWVVAAVAKASSNLPLNNGAQD